LDATSLVTVFVDAAVDGFAADDDDEAAAGVDPELDDPDDPDDPDALV
jgi:hypothetical protein